MKYKAIGNTIIAFICFVSISPRAFAIGVNEINKYKAVFTEFPKHTPSKKTVDAPITGNGDIGLTMVPSHGKLVFYVGKNDFWKAVESKPEGRIALPGGLTITSEIFTEKEYYAEQLPGSAELKAVFRGESNELHVNAWVPALENIIIIELESSKQLRLQLDLWTPNDIGSVTEYGTENGCTWLHRSFDNLEYLLWPTYMAMAMNRTNGDVVLPQGKKMTLVLAIYTNHDTEQWHTMTTAGVANITEEALTEIKKQHLDWWDSFWSLSEVRFSDDYLEKYYYQSQYIFACASRKGKFAPGIWGPFITTDYSEWCGDYHLNYNYEAPYWASFSSNHICLTDNYDDPMLAYMDRGRQHARNLFKCRGIAFPVGIGPKGLCTSVWPRDPQKMKSMYGVEVNTLEDGVGFLQQKINASFAAANMMMRFYSTYDKEYARKIYPFVKACAEFWEDYLIYEKGRYVVKGDAFNEHYPWQKYNGDDNSVLSLGLIKMVFQSVETLSCHLKVDKRKRAKWKQIRNKLSDYPTGINDQGRLSFKPSENEGVKPSGISRIHIHGILLPTGMTGPNLTPKYNDIMLNDMKGWYPYNGRDWGSSLNNGIETVYPAAARVGYPAKKLLEQLRERIKLASYPNCYIYASGGGIETLSAVPNTINEMMMQSYEGIIRIFPNWDREIDGSFRDLRAYGAFLVSSSMRNGKIERVIIKSEQGRNCKIENPWPNCPVRVTKNNRQWKTFEGVSFDFKTKKDDVFVFNCISVNGISQNEKSRN